jgi:hypothetical protein
MSPRSLGAFLAVVSLVAVAVAAGVGTPAVAAGGSVDTPSVHTAGCQSVKNFDTTGCRISSDSYSRQYQSEDAGVTTHTPGTTDTPDPTATREPATTTMRLQVQADGDARWRVSATYEFRDDADAAAFDDVAAAFEAGEASIALDALGLARENASAATGREMTFRNVERTASRNDTTGEGTLTLAVTWTNFARVDGDRLYVGDAFNTTDGTWLPRLTERQTLVVEPPEGYRVVSAPQVGIVDGTARWEGPRRLDGREPWIVYSGESPATTATTTTLPPTTTTLPPTTTPPGNGSLSSLVSVAFLVLVAAASAAVLAVYVRREGRPGGGAATESDDAGDGGADAEAGSGADETDQATPDEETADTTAGPDATGEADEPDGPATGSAGATAANAGATAESDDGIDEELLSDEERVERLLERNGGRMKQATIVKETGWSNAKVSQLLSSMAEEDRVDKLRIGRENLISFPDEDVADVGGDDED